MFPISDLVCHFSCFNLEILCVKCIRRCFLKGDEVNQFTTFWSQGHCPVFICVLRTRLFVEKVIFMNILYKVIFCSLSDLCDVINCICMHYFLGPVWYNVIHRERGLGLAMLIGLICPIHSHPTYLFIQSLHTDTHINIKPQAKTDT